MSDELKLRCVYCKGEHATVDCPKWEGQSELAPARGWGEPDKKLAKLHMDLAGIALDAAYNNGRVIDVAVGHLEAAIEALRPVNPNEKGQR